MAAGLSITSLQPSSLRRAPHPYVSGSAVEIHSSECQDTPIQTLMVNHKAVGGAGCIAHIYIIFFFFLPFVSTIKSKDSLCLLEKDV